MKGFNNIPFENKIKMDSTQQQQQLLYITTEFRYLSYEILSPFISLEFEKAKDWNIIKNDM